MLKVYWFCWDCACIGEFEFQVTPESYMEGDFFCPECGNCSLDLDEIVNL